MLELFYDNVSPLPPANTKANTPIITLCESRFSIIVVYYALALELALELPVGK